ncbi:Xanthomonalisin [Thalassocella blandensis]|nr:Xanthomonalisin [Thalassocella blandensis]
MFKHVSKKVSAYLLAAPVALLFAAQVFAYNFNNGDSIAVSGNADSYQYHTVSVPANAANLQIQLAGGSGDADVYVRFGSQPTASLFDCRPYQWGNNESCYISSPSAGTYYIMLHGYSSFAGANLAVSFDGGVATPTPTPTPSVPPSNSGSTIDIVTYNVEWLGNPSQAGYNGSRGQQINAAAEDILNGGGEIYALQEVGGSSTLDDLLIALNALDSVNHWQGNVSQPTATQSLAFVYNASVVSNTHFQTILTDQNNTVFAGRYPYLMTANISISGISKNISLINLHLKCCTGATNASRRADAAALVVDELNTHYRTANMMILGDLNVAESGGAYGELNTWGFYDDRDGNGIDDFSHAAGSVEDKPYDANVTESDIDHILISDELYAAWSVISPSVRNRYLTTTVSDHSPVKTTLDLVQIGASNPNPTPNPSPLPGGISVTQALSLNVGASATVVGVVQEGFNSSYALIMRDINNANATIVVKLENSQRNQWSPVLNPSVIGKTIRVAGKRDVYSNLPSLESVSSIQE